MNVSDHLAARDRVTIGKAAAIAAEVHPVVPGFRTWQRSQKYSRSGQYSANPFASPIAVSLFEGDILAYLYLIQPNRPATTWRHLPSPG